jgi:hypothetical protein
MSDLSTFFYFRPAAGTARETLFGLIGSEAHNPFLRADEIWIKI